MYVSAYDSPTNHAVQQITNLDLRLIYIKGKVRHEDLGRVSTGGRGGNSGSDDSVAVSRWDRTRVSFAGSTLSIGVGRSSSTTD